MNCNKHEIKIAIIGLGYVGLPLAVEFAKKFPVVGFDIDQKRITELSKGNDTTLEVDEEQLNAVLDKKEKDECVGLSLSHKEEDLRECNVYIVTVPTPIDKNNRPILTPLIRASEMVGRALRPENIVVYESTVYPGVTEEECVPVLEHTSGLKYNKDFFCGYSPERINPGDKKHTVTKIKKVTSGSTLETAKLVDELYGTIIAAGTHLTSSIKVAEAAKVIENAQRDINIAFVNELAKIFNKLNVDTHDVLEAAGTKWNFLPFKPGLVGGHCIGVDPYYLAQKAQEIGYHPEIILSGRRVNDGMGDYISSEIIKLLAINEIRIKGAKVLILGITFKENCPDIRNTKVIDVLRALELFHMEVSVYDPWANASEVKNEYGVDILKSLDSQKFDAIVQAVAHAEFQTIDIQALKKEKAIIYDIKGTLDKKIVDSRL